MKSTFLRILTIATLGLIAVCASASVASAQNAFKGKFTLPEDVRWGNASLPAGDYTMSVKSIGLPVLVTLEGSNGGTFIMTGVTDKRDLGGSSNLTIERRNGDRFVSKLYLADFGMELKYQVPSQAKGERELAQGPASTEQVLIAKN
jgi:hypothetical protein